MVDTALLALNILHIYAQIHHKKYNMSYVHAKQELHNYKIKKRLCKWRN